MNKVEDRSMNSIGKTLARHVKGRKNPRHKYPHLEM